MEHKAGFTLIELLVVVLILGILASIALPQYQKAVWKTRLSALLPTLDAMIKTHDLYYLEHGEFPLFGNDGISDNLNSFVMLDVIPPSGTQYYCTKRHPTEAEITASEGSLTAESWMSACQVKYRIGSNGIAGVGWNYNTRTRTCFSSDSIPQAAEACKSLTGDHSEGVASSLYRTHVWNFQR